MTRKLVKTRNSASKDYDVWHFERSEDCVPLCHRRTKWWTGGQFAGGKNMTENVKYVTCKKCLELLEAQKMKKIEIKFKKLHPAAKAPYRATVGSAGFDLTATSKEVIDLHHTRFGTGLAVEIPAGHVGLVFPRSSCYKQGMLLSNCVGVIDSDYRGEITAIFLGTSVEHCYNIGDRICQLVIMPIPEVEFIESEELTDTERGISGYGSTGR